MPIRRTIWNFTSRESGAKARRFRKYLLRHRRSARFAALAIVFIAFSLSTGLLTPMQDAFAKNSCPTSTFAATATSTVNGFTLGITNCSTAHCAWNGINSASGSVAVSCSELITVTNTRTGEVGGSAT